MKDLTTGIPDERHLLSTLGLCRRAGGLISGTPMVCEAMKDGKRILAVIEASDTSDNTHQRLSSKCEFYHVPHYRIRTSTQDLAHAIGKSGAVAAVGITHEGLMAALQKHLPKDP